MQLKFSTTKLNRFYRKLRRFSLRVVLTVKGQTPPPLSPIIGIRARNPRSSWDEPGFIRIAIKVTGGIGDMVVVARLIRDLCRQVGSLKLHIYCPATPTATWVFEPIAEVEALYSEVFFDDARPSYDCAFVINQMAFYYGETANYSKIRQVAPRLLGVLESLKKSREVWNPYIAHHPFLDGAMAHTAVSLGETRNSLLHSMFGLEHQGEEFSLRVDTSFSEKIRATHPAWISIHNGFDINSLVKVKIATKCYPPQSWEAVVHILKMERPDIGIVQIGSHTSTRLSGVDIDLVDRTSLAQAASIIKDSLLHVDNESGLVHVAASFGKKSVVLFGPTSERYFSYPQNVNISSDFCGNCWWSKKTWMSACPRGYESAMCMDRLAPEVVAAAVLREV